MQNQWHMSLGADEAIPKQTRINTQQSKQSQQENQNHQQILQLNVASFLGLNKILLDKIVFKRQQQKYYIRKVYNQNAIVSDQIHSAPKDFTMEVQVLQNNRHSVPVCRLKPNIPEYDSVIIYAHGNASDLLDSLQYMEKLAQQLKIQIVTFDYSGYGCSKISDITEQTLRRDLQLVIAWLSETTPLNRIILWGFSLGTYPVCYCASKYRIRGTILQSPLASIGCLFKQDQIDPQTHIQNDHIVNLNYIHKIKSPLIIMHSKIDKIVPFSHSIALVKKYIKYNDSKSILFLEVGNLQHNQMHHYFISENNNMLKQQLAKFIKKLQSPNMSMSACMQNIYDRIENNFLTVPSSSILGSLRSSKIKIVSEVIYPNSGRKHKKNELQKIRSTFNLAKIPGYNSQQEEVEIENGIITRKFNNKNYKCYCLQKC